MSKSRQFFQRFFSGMQIPALFMKSQAVDTAEAECNAMEQLFTLLTAGTFVGMPSLPLPITFELLPYMEDELSDLLRNVNTIDQPLSYLFSVMNVS